MVCMYHCTKKCVKSIRDKMQKVGTQTLVQKSIIKIEYGNCDHKKDPFFLENTVNFIDLRRPLTSSMVSRKLSNISMVLKRPLQIFNGFLRRPSPLNVFWRSDHCHQWFFNGFWSCYHRFQWFSMVPDHWSNDAMVSMDRCGLTQSILRHCNRI